MAATVNTSAAKPIICIVGPTASGKSALAQNIALSVNGEVVSADSMQIYKGMDIGTGKLPAKDRKVAHHGLDIVEPGEPFSAALFQEYARDCFADIEARGARAILCGGTGFYVRAAIDDYQFPKGEQVENPIREECLRIAREYGADELWNRLQDRDAASAAIIPPNDVKRVARAFELLAEGTTYAQQKSKLAHIAEKLPSVWIGLSVAPEILRERIDARVDAMVEEGLIEEVQRLLDRGLTDALTANQAIGYKEIVGALQHVITMDQAIENIKTATRQYAKRQRTWFRKEARVNWIDANDNDQERMLRCALDIIEREDKRLQTHE